MVRNRNGKVIMTLDKADMQPVYDLGWKAPERFKVKAADGVTDLYGVMWKPADFDSTKVYPIISNVYPGPFFEYVLLVLQSMILTIPVWPSLDL